MYKHVLIATDGSELANKALEHGLALAKRNDASVSIVTVTEPWSAFEMAQQAREHRSDPVGQFEATAADTAKRILDGALKQAEACGVQAAGVHVKDQYPAEGIIATARDKGCDLIVLASHGRRGLPRLLLGSQAYEVLTRCTVPALIVR
jgi:nucleotide-binding universal stress UspA family protein